MTISEQISKLSDSELYTKCKEYGLNARLWLRKFVSLLPEVEKRQLYKKKGYASIYEFARKLAGMSDYTVDKILNLAKKLENKPILKEQFLSGKQGWSKIETVAYIATPQTDKFWAKKVETLTKLALVAYIQEIKQKETKSKVMLRFIAGNESNNTSKFPQTDRAVDGTVDGVAVDGAAADRAAATATEENDSLSRFSFFITPQLEYQLRFFKQKLEKQRKQTLAWGEVMEELLKGYKKLKEENNEKENNNRENIISLCPTCIKSKTNASSADGTVGRYIPQAVRRLTLARYKNRCAYPSCNHPPDIFHHTERFSLNKNHDPDSIVPLCKTHERLIHSGLIENENNNPLLWKILKEPDFSSPKFSIDEKVKLHRREPIH